MKVKDVMSEGAECVSPSASLQEAASKMKHLDVGSLPVCEGDRLVGVLTDRDTTCGPPPRRSRHGSARWGT
jgi:CBS domain-containing protein